MGLCWRTIGGGGGICNILELINPKLFWLTFVIFIIKIENEIPRKHIAKDFHGYN